MTREDGRVWAAHWMGSPTLRWAVAQLVERGEGDTEMADALAVTVADAGAMRTLVGVEGR